MKVLVTGADGFVGKNLCLFLSKKSEVEIFRFTKSTSLTELESFLEHSDFIVHLAGVNRPKNDQEFVEGNENLTNQIISILRKLDKKTPILFSSSIQANLQNPYGISKKSAEKSLLQYNAETGASVYIYQLPNLFGKFSKPNYNSVVATFAYNLIHGIPLEIHDPTRVLHLNYIDDVVSSFFDKIVNQPGIIFQEVRPVYTITVGELQKILTEFNDTRKLLRVGSVGDGLGRALYSTYISFLDIKDCHYPITQNADPRGRFVEMLKTPTSGQFSYFTAPPGATRGRHYHHTKTEKFLIIQGTAKFRFQHTITNEYHELVVSGNQPTIVDTIPGWTHDISNIGSDELIVMLWANEIFDQKNPDTFSAEIST
ncbi:NAD-dependent epimerase/dehydratase family protein [Leptospira sp. 201903075]|uniref:UDP-2-acetamido-2,6-beta-L-arabino-hexul-4-ose reductase n=1 Tax=Leptospira chreensis TaxID=2810035 RepID=UPI001964342E|nr:NAD-dependent epimerase/dehydratase family protein [Leptospira chreensis]MBM9589039.1 NAD-dependent epimerase/dehydratase family protein [Leptospira chreensis]